MVASLSHQRFCVVSLSKTSDLYTLLVESRKLSKLRLGLIRKSEDHSRAKGIKWITGSNKEKFKVETGLKVPVRKAEDHSRVKGIKWIYAFI